MVGCGHCHSSVELIFMSPAAAAVWRGAPDSGCGRVAAFGTAAVFDRDALQLPANSSACDLLFDWLRPV